MYQVQIPALDFHSSEIWLDYCYGLNYIPFS